MDETNVPEILGIELARKKAETRRMARWLRGKDLAVRGKKKEMKRIKRVNKLMFAVNRRMQKMVDDFLAAADAENSGTETANICTEEAVRELTEGMNDLNLEGNDTIAMNQVQSCCGSGSAANGGNN